MSHLSEKEIAAAVELCIEGKADFVKQEDVLSNLCMEGSTDVIRMCNSLALSEVA